MEPRVLNVLIAPACFHLRGRWRLTAAFGTKSAMSSSSTWVRTGSVPCASGLSARGSDALRTCLTIVCEGRACHVPCASRPCNSSHCRWTSSTVLMTWIAQRADRHRELAARSRCLAGHLWKDLIKGPWTSALSDSRPAAGARNRDSLETPRLSTAQVRCAVFQWLVAAST